MTDESRLLASIWERVGDFISAGDKKEAAAAMLRGFLDVGYEIHDLIDADGECPYMDKALAEMMNEAEDEFYEEPEY